MSAVRAPKKAIAVCPHGDFLRIYWEEPGKPAPAIRAALALRAHRYRKHPKKGRKP